MQKIQPKHTRLRTPFAACVLILLLGTPIGCVSTSKLDLSGMSFSSEPLLGKVVWNDLITEDLEAARRFYGELFGWTFEQGARPSGRPYWLARSGKVYVAGMVEAPPPANRGTALARAGNALPQWLQRQRRRRGQCGCSDRQPRLHERRHEPLVLSS
jgi:Bleomycin resistance protein-like N-terminal